MELKRLLEYFDMKYFELCNEDYKTIYDNNDDYVEIDIKIGYASMIAQLS